MKSIPVIPAQSIDVIVNHTRYTSQIDALYVVGAEREVGTLTIFACNEKGVQALFVSTNKDAWPAWLTETIQQEERGAAKIETTEGLMPGMVVLTGTAYYKVTEVFRKGQFRGRIWDESSEAWGALKDVPLPSPTCAAYVLSEDETAKLFRR